VPLDLAKAKQHLRVEDESNDALIQTYLDAAIAVVEGLSGRIIAEREVRQPLDSLSGRNGRGEIELAWLPVVSGTKIEYLDSDGSNSELVLADGDFRLAAGSPPYLLPPIGGSWPSIYVGRNAATVVYRAGYGGDAGELPADLEAAALQQLGHFYMNREAVTEEYNREVPLSVRTICDRYRGIL
jgi:uncharacterized phiE125 gp8 family phage protein